MSFWEDQIQQNTSAISQIFENAKQINDHDPILGELTDDVVFLIQVPGQIALKATFAQIKASIQISSGSAVDREVFTATAGQTNFLLSTSPTFVQVFNGETHLTDTDDFVLTGNSLDLSVGAFLGSKITVIKYS